MFKLVHVRAQSSSNSGGIEDELAALQKQNEELRQRLHSFQSKKKSGTSCRKAVRCRAAVMHPSKLAHAHNVSSHTATTHADGMAVMGIRLAA